jgi:hypothetical protein
MIEITNPQIINTLLFVKSASVRSSTEAVDKITSSASTSTILNKNGYSLANLAKETSPE